MKKRRDLKCIHPLWLSKRLRLSGILLILPLIREIISHPQSTAGIIASAGTGTIYSASVILWTVLSFRNYRYELSDSGIKISSGVLRNSRFCMPFERITTVTLRQGILGALSRGMWVVLATPGRIGFRRSISICLRRSEAVRLPSLPVLPENDIFRAKRLYVLAMSLSGTNPFSGLALLAPAVSETGRILRLKPSGIISAAENIPFYSGILSPAARLTAFLIIIGYLSGVTIIFFRNIPFLACKSSGSIIVSRGFLQRSLTVVSCRAVSAVVFERSLLMSLCSLCRASVIYAGTYRRKSDKQLIIPSGRTDDVHSRAGKLTGIPVCENRISVSSFRILGAVIPPVFSAIGAYASLSAVRAYASIDLHGTALLLMIPILWWTIFRCYASYISSVSAGDKCLEITTFSGLTLRQYCIPYSGIDSLSVAKRPFSRRCRLIVHDMGGVRLSVPMNMSASEASELFEICRPRTDIILK